MGRINVGNAANVNSPPRDRKDYSSWTSRHVAYRPHDHLAFTGHVRAINDQRVHGGFCWLTLERADKTRVEVPAEDCRLIDAAGAQS